MNRCPACKAHVLVYDWDHDLACYLGPDRVDPTPLTVELAVACRITGRSLYTHSRDRAGRPRMSRVRVHRPLPAEQLLPAHVCGARTPTTIPLANRTPVPDTCPF